MFDQQKIELCRKTLGVQSLRRFAIKELAKIGTREAIFALLDELGSKRPYIINTSNDIIAALNSLDESSIPFLIEYFQGPFPLGRRVEAVRILGKFRTSEVTEALSKAVRSDDLWMRNAAMEGLIKNDDPSNLKTIVAAIPYLCNGHRHCSH